MNFKKGDVYYISSIGASKKPYKIHILEIIDETMIVFKWYGRRNQWWHYKIEHTQILSLKIKRQERS